MNVVFSHFTLAVCGQSNFKAHGRQNVKFKLKTKFAFEWKHLFFATLQVRNRSILVKINGKDIQIRYESASLGAISSSDFGIPQGRGIKV